MRDFYNRCTFVYTHSASTNWLMFVKFFKKKILFVLLSGQY
jgi:hypothetical protein